MFFILSVGSVGLPDLFDLPDLFGSSETGGLTGLPGSPDSVGSPPNHLPTFSIPVLNVYSATGYIAASAV